MRRGLRRGKGMYSWVLWFGQPAQRGGRAPPAAVHCCTKYAAETKSAVYGSKWCDGPGAVVATATDLTAHAGSKVHLAALQHVATRLGIVASMGLWWPPKRCLM